VIATTKPYRNLPGDWRRQYGTKTDGHLWHDGSDYALPLCRKKIEHYRTLPLDRGRPCTDCLVAGIRTEVQTGS
jgi:hypothetical protein